jgi:hypothetical protein
MVLGRGLVGADEVRVTVAKVLDNEDDAEIERERERESRTRCLMRISLGLRQRVPRNC